MTSRRRFLAAALGVGGASLAGCVMRGPGPRPAEDPWLERSEGPDGKRLEGTVKLRRGEYVAYRFGTDTDKSLEVKLTARSRLSLPFDILTFLDRDFPKYRTGDVDDKTAISTFTALGIEQFHFSNLLTPAQYVLVFDNTRIGDARPLDDVTISFSFQYTL